MTTIEQLTARVERLESLLLMSTKQHQIVVKNHINQSLDAICDVVSDKFKIPKQAITGPTRTMKIFEARVAFCWFANVMFNYSQESIGDYLNRCHSSVSYASGQVDVLKRYGDFKNKFNEAQLALEGKV